MYRAEIVESLSPGWVMITIPALYRDSPVGPVACAVEVVPGDRVVVADLRPEARLRDWWVLGHESRIGRFGDPYPHTHPIGQVEGLPEALDAKADTTALDGYATTTAVDTGLAGKADVAGAWAACDVTPLLTPDSADAPPLAMRATPFGNQLRGFYQATDAVARDVHVFTVPTGLAPAYTVYLNVPTMGPTSTDFAATKRQLRIGSDGVVTTREPLVLGDRLSFNHTLLY